MKKITLAELEKEHENERKSSCTLYIVLFSIIYAINIGIDNFLVTRNA